MINKDKISEEKLCSICLDMLNDFDGCDSNNIYNHMQIKTSTMYICGRRIRIIKYVPIISEPNNCNKYPITIMVRENVIGDKTYTISMDVIVITKEAGLTLTSLEQLKRVVKPTDLEINSH